MLMGCDLVSRPTLENTEHHNEDSSPDAPGITTDSLDTESAEENAPIDMDNDGYAVENDCNDEDPTIHPEAQSSSREEGALTLLCELSATLSATAW